MPCGFRYNGGWNERIEERMGRIVADGLWCDVRSADFPRGRPALFADRDGTLIEHVHYLSAAEDVEPVRAALDAVRAANAAGWAVVVVTNQSAIGRGYFGWEAFEAVQTRMHELFDDAGATIDAAYAASHAPPDAGGPADSPWRKPAPGMLLRAAEDLGIDLAASIIAGDGAHDLAAGKAAGLHRGLLVPTGYGSRAEEQEKARALADDTFRAELGPLDGLAF